MEQMFSVSAGIDVHRDTVVVSIRRRNEAGRELVQTQTFETFYDSLVHMAQWLDEHGAEVVGLESTGVYWKPVVRVLQERSPKLLVWLVNPAQVKKVPGRKTDVSDSQWLSKLAMYGLVSPSFLPSVAMQELRTLTRHRTKLVGHLVSYKNRIVKELESAGIKLASVCSDPLGKSARAMVEALLEGQKTPAQIAELAQGAMRKKRAELQRALTGTFSPASQFVLRQLLKRLREVEQDVAQVDAQVAELLKPYAPEVELLRSVPGVDVVVAAAVLAEAGPDLSSFNSAARLASWAGLSPGSNESAGKDKAAPSRKGDKYLRTMLVQASHGAVKTRSCPWRDQFGALARRIGPNTAHFAIARKMLVAIFYILRAGTPYAPPKPTPPTPKQAKRLAARYIQRIQALGFEVTLAPIATPTPPAIT